MHTFIKKLAQPRKLRKAPVRTFIHTFTIPASDLGLASICGCDCSDVALKRKVDIKYGLSRPRIWTQILCRQLLYYASIPWFEKCPDRSRIPHKRLFCWRLRKRRAIHKPRKSFLALARHFVRDLKNSILLKNNDAKKVFCFRPSGKIMVCCWFPIM